MTVNVPRGGAVTPAMLKDHPGELPDVLNWKIKVVDDRTITADLLLSVSQNCLCIQI